MKPSWRTLLMKPKRKDEIRERVDDPVSASGTGFSQKKSEKPGLLRRFLDWIAKGADGAGAGGQSCPS